MRMTFNKTLGWDWLRCERYFIHNVAIATVTPVLASELICTRRLQNYQILITISTWILSTRAPTMPKTMTKTKTL